MSAQHTKEQERAAVAWSCVEEVKPKSWQGKYGAWVKKFPALVLTNGLGHALAFLRSKNKEHHSALYGHVSSWTTKEIFGVASGDDKLLERLMGAHPYEARADSDMYRRATTEALAFTVWLKRFAEAELKIEEGEE
jgi:CRISPR-associated protein Cmr5